MTPSDPRHPIPNPLSPQYLNDFKGTVVCITHDRYFLENSCGWILELDRGEGIPYEGNYSGWLEKKKKRFEDEKKQDERLKVLHCHPPS